ncbi:hypothetical protein QQ045_018628 [Rhodiola kirilowii]
MEDEDDYKYLRIQDAISSIGQNVSLVGIVSDAGLPRPSRGTDFFCTLKIVDESCSKTGLKVNVFGDGKGALPCVKSVGDIVILSHVKVQPHFVTFSKKSSSFALYEGSHGRGFTPYQVSANYHSTERDKKFVARMRRSLVCSQIVSESKMPSFMRETKQEERCTMICKVLHIRTLPKDEWCAFIWDGTDVPPLKIKNKLEDEKSHPILLHLENFSLPIQTLRTFPLVGTILRMVPAKGVREMEMNSLVCHKWFKLVNIILEAHEGLWQAVVMPFTRLLCLSDEDPMVIEYERKYTNRVSNKCDHMPYWCFPAPSLITATEHDSGDFVTLREVLTHRSVTGKFKCVVRVVALIPWRVADFRTANGTYRLRLTLEDATARIHAFIHAEDGEQLFGQNPTMAELTSKRNKMLGIQVGDGNEHVNFPRDPPWCEFCIKSYYLDKKDPWGSRHYRIFGSEFRDLV